MRLEEVQEHDNTDGIQPAQYVLRDISLTRYCHFDRRLYLERFVFSLPVTTFFFF
jgi:hypothetical protein